MVTYEITEKVALRIKLDPSERENLREMLDNAKANRRGDILGDVIEGMLANGFQWVQPKDIGALTDAPIISDEADFDDFGDLVKIGRVFYYADYQVKDPVEVLYEKGEVIFDVAQ
jgi:hypothetical protein